MRNKIVSVADAIAIIRSNDTICTSGFVGIGVPDDLLLALENRFLTEELPRDLTLIFAAGQGDGKERGLNRLGHLGLLRRVIGGHWGLIPKIGKLALDNQIEAYNLPQGCISQLYRDIAAGKPGLHTKVGLRTFVDPRIEGGRINACTTKDIVEFKQIDGEDWLFYRSQPIDIALIRGTTADPEGNITMEREALVLDNLSMAMAAKNSQGFVIAQVERLADSDTLHPREVQIPGVLVDCVVIAPPENHAQTYATPYSPAFSAEIRVPLDTLPASVLDERKIIARRCSFELPPNGVVNLGIGMPEGVASVAAEEKILRLITLTAEAGVIGGVPQSGLDFGAAINTAAIIQQNQQFDFYDGGGLDMACLGMAECDAAGNVNVSRFGSKLAGAGGFINISQTARKCVFAGSFTTGGLRLVVKDGAVDIVKEGRARKFRDKVQQVTFSGPYAAENQRPILYVTERCVFRLTVAGVELIEIAPGIDIARDILAHMDFHPIINKPRLMNAAIFIDEPMRLAELLLQLDLTDRISYDCARNTLFLNFENMQIRTYADVESIQNAVEAKCLEIGYRVNTVVNYDGVRIDDSVLDLYADMAGTMTERHYLHVSRYTTSAFMRIKLGDKIRMRGSKPHIFESAVEAHRNMT